MALPHTFANETSPGMKELDDNFAVLSIMGTTFCTTTGTNTITITPQANQPTVSAYVNQQLFGFTAANSSNGSVSLQVGSLSSLPLYLIGGAQAGSGDITSGTPYIIEYLAALNSGGGGFQIVSAVPSSAAVAQSNGLLHGLLLFNNSGTPSTKIDITAGYSTLTTTGGTPKFLSSASVTIDLTTTGANGMDTGARPTSGWVYCYVINNGSVTAGLATATSPTAGLPTFPGGYSNFVYVGAMYCDASQNLLRTRQSGRRAQFTLVASTNTAVVPIIANGTAGTYSGATPTLSAVTVTGNTAGLAPLTAGSVEVIATNTWKNGSTASVIVAPSTAYGGTNNGPTGSTGNFFPIVVTSAAANGVVAEMVLEAATIAWASSAAGGAIGMLAWTDYYSAG